MPGSYLESKNRLGSKIRTVNLSGCYNWPNRVPKNKWWQNLAAEVDSYPSGRQQPWGIPFRLGHGSGPRVLMATKNSGPIAVRINAKATYLCFLHTWEQLPKTIRREDPTEGLVVAEYELAYHDASRHVQPVRGRFEVAMIESLGPPWQAVEFKMPVTVDPTQPTAETNWGHTQLGVNASFIEPKIPLLLYAMSNPSPDKRIVSIGIRGLQESPLIVAGLTLFQGSAHPLRHLPRRTYRVRTPGKLRSVEKAKIDLGGIARIERTSGPRGKRWLDSPYVGVPRMRQQQRMESERNGEDLIEAYGAEDATMSVTLKGKKKPIDFSLGQAFHKGKSTSGKATLEVLGKRRQWMQIRVIDSSTGKPTPARVHFSGSRGEYLAPYGHHAQINTNWFEDYGSDVVVGGRNYAYVPGEFTTDLPVGDVYMEICKGFEYEPVRRKMTIKPGQRTLDLHIDRWKDLRSQGWVTADTHVHFLSPQTAWLQAQAEGINVANLLASQWGRLFTNVGDYTGRVGVVENDTIVYVGTENRNHMLGHMSMLGTKGLPVYPMCCGGPTESWVADPDFRMLAEWALENKRKGGVVIRPHYPYCGHTEDPVPILKGLVDALELQGWRAEDFPVQEWYRYLNCGYRVAVAGGTDKMSANTALGCLRTYAKLNPNRPFSYENWAAAVRAGRTVATGGPVMDLTVEGRSIGDTIKLPVTGGTLEVQAIAESFWPLGKLELVCNGRVVASRQAPKGSKKLHVKDKIRITSSGWIAARCSGYVSHPGSWTGAHTSPVYIKCGRTRAFDGPAAEHMLALVEGGIEYLQTLATVFDEPSRRRMAKLFNEARMELTDRLTTEVHRTLHHGSGHYHTHGHGHRAGHHH